MPAAVRSKGIRYAVSACEPPTTQPQPSASRDARGTFLPAAAPPRIRSSARGPRSPPVSRALRHTAVWGWNSPPAPFARLRKSARVPTCAAAIAPPPSPFRRRASPVPSSAARLCRHSSVTALPLRRCPRPPLIPRRHRRPPAHVAPQTAPIAIPQPNCQHRRVPRRPGAALPTRRLCATMNVPETGNRSAGAAGAQVPYKHKVGGSNPSPTTTNSSGPGYFLARFPFPRLH